MNKEDNKKNFSTNISGDTIIQLKDGRLLVYYFRNNDKISIYDQNTFKETIKISLYDIIYQNKKKKYKQVKKVKKVKEEKEITKDQKKSKGCISSIFSYISSFFYNHQKKQEQEEKYNEEKKR